MEENIPRPGDIEGCSDGRINSKMTKKNNIYTHCNPVKINFE